MEPLFVRIPVQSFDLSLLPSEARKIGSAAFKDAVTEHFVKEYAPTGRSVVVTVDDTDITITAIEGGSPFDYVLTLLNNGRIKEALPLLERFVSTAPNDVDGLYNLGIAYSELGRYDDALTHLKRAVNVQPTHSRAWTGIGVAHARLMQPNEAIKALNKAVEADPGDGYAHRNLGAVLCGQNKFEEALPHLREALHQLPDDPQAVFGLAQCLEALDGDHVAEADRLYQDLIRRFPGSPLVEMAKQARSTIGQRSMRSAAPGGFRPDVLMYLQGALDTFARVGPKKTREITIEVALLGQRGLDINDPEQKYSLKTLPGKFSGLHLVSLMYAGMKQLDPTMDPGIDLSNEYAMAKKLRK